MRFTALTIVLVVGNLDLTKAFLAHSGSKGVLRLSQPSSPFVLFDNTGGNDEPDILQNKDSDGEPLIGELQDEMVETQELATENELRIKELEEQIIAYENTITEKEKSLKKENEAWSLEKNTFLAKVSDLTRQLQNKEAEIASEFETREANMNKSVDELKAELEKTRQSLAEEQEIGKKLREMIGTTQDMLEFEQMNFQKEKEQLDQQIKTGVSLLDKVQNKFQNERIQFEQNKKEMAQQLKNEAEKLLQAKSNLQKVNEQFSQETAELQKEIQTLKDLLKNKEKDMLENTNRFSNERRQITAEIAQNKEALQKAEELLAKKEKEFESNKASLQERLDEEKKLVSQLSVDLETQAKKFANEKQELRKSLEDERTKSASVQEQLEIETQKFEKDRAKFEKELTESVRIRQLKAKQMKERYNQIRSEMTELWEQTKRDARQEKKLLKEKYQNKLDAVNAVVTDLEGKVASSKSETEATKVQLTSMTNERDKAIKFGKITEERYQTLLSDRNAQIFNLRNNVQNLSSTVKKQDEQIEKYEGSFREMAKLSLKLTAKRARNVFRRKKKKD